MLLHHLTHEILICLISVILQIHQLWNSNNKGLYFTQDIIWQLYNYIVANSTLEISTNFSNHYIELQWFFNNLNKRKSLLSQENSKQCILSKILKNFQRWWSYKIDNNFTQLQFWILSYSLCIMDVKKIWQMWKCVETLGKLKDLLKRKDFQSKEICCSHKSKVKIHSHSYWL